MFLCDVYDSCDHFLADMCNLIGVHIPLGGVLFAIDRYIFSTLVIGIQYKTFLFLKYPCIDCITASLTEYIHIMLSTTLNVVPFLAFLLNVLYEFWLISHIILTNSSSNFNNTNLSSGTLAFR